MCASCSVRAYRQTNSPAVHRICVSACGLAIGVSLPGDLELRAWRPASLARLLFRCLAVRGLRSASSSLRGFVDRGLWFVVDAQRGHARVRGRRLSQCSVQCSAVQRRAQLERLETGEWRHGSWVGGCKPRPGVVSIGGQRWSEWSGIRRVSVPRPEKGPRTAENARCRVRYACQGCSSGSRRRRRH